MVFTEGTNIQDHIKLLHSQRATVDNQSTSIMRNETWRGVIIHSIPPTTKWLPVIPSLYLMASSADIISTLFAHGMIIGREIPTKTTTSMSQSNTVLAARMTESCTNPNCKAKKRSTHMMANCYWPGGGKEGQFPLNFGQRNWVNVIATNPTPTTPTTQPQAEHFILLAQVPTNMSGKSGILVNIPIDLPVPVSLPAMVLISQGFQKFQKGKVPTFMDSGASDMMFVSRDVFTDYKSFTPRVGDLAKAEGGSFEIVSKGNVVQHYQVDGVKCKKTELREIPMIGQIGI